MSNHASSPSLTDLEQRLGRQRQSRAKKIMDLPKPDPAILRLVGRAGNVAFRFVLPLILLGGTGVILDDLLLFSPVFQIVLFFIGAVIGFRSVYQSVHHDLKNAGVQPQRLRGLALTPLVPGEQSAGWRGPRGM